MKLCLKKKKKKKKKCFEAGSEVGRPRDRGSFRRHAAADSPEKKMILLSPGRSSTASILVTSAGSPYQNLWMCTGSLTMLRESKRQNHCQTEGTVTCVSCIKQTKKKATKQLTSMMYLWYVPCTYTHAR